MPRKPASDAAPKPKRAKRSGPGRPAFVPTDAQRQRVQLAIADGRTWDEIAERLGITRPTLAKHFKPELEKGKDRFREIITGQMYKQAAQGFWPAIQFIARTKFGYSETHKHEVGGNPDAPPIQIASLSTEQLIVALATLDGTARAGAVADRRGVAAEEDSD